MEEDAETLKAFGQFLSIAGKAGKITDDDRQQVWSQIMSKEWSALEVFEWSDRLYFPTKVFKRDAKTGKFVGVDYALRVPRGDDFRRARLEAIKIFKDEGLDREKDRDLFDDLESLCILWLSVREKDEPHEQIAMDARDLEKRYDRGSLEQVNFVLNQLKRTLDPRVSGMEAGELEALTAAIVARQSIVPLAAFDDATQVTFVITMARLHQALLTARSSSPSPAPSIAD